jgi:hypothetical protein
MVALALLAAARAADVLVVLPDGPLRPGLPGRVDVACGGCEALLEAPGAEVLPLDGGGFRVVPPLGVETLALRAVADAAAVTRVVVVAWPEPSAVGVRTRSDASTRAEAVDLEAAGASWALSTEGAVEATESGFALRPDPGGSARVIGLAFRGRGEERPAWSAVRLRARLGLPYDVEPGASLALRVGNRPYGPFSADASGHVDAVVDQWPGETSAEAVFTDALGNTTRATLPLPGGGEPVLLLVPPAPGGRTGWAAAWAADGDPWRGAAPSCDVAGSPVPVVALAPGEYALVLPEIDPAAGLRASCRLGQVGASLRVPPETGRPVRVQLRVWPEEIDADFPAAEVRAMVVDALGDPLPVAGLELASKHGALSGGTPGPGDRTLFAAWSGAPGVSADDEITATLPLEPGSGPPVRLGAGLSRWDDGQLAVWATASDGWGRPVEGAAVAFEIGARTASARTGPDGLAVARIEEESGEGNRLLRVRCGRVVVERSVAPSGPFSPAPDPPALVARRAIAVRPGRAVDLGIEVDPQSVRTGSAASIRVTVRDRSGRDAPDPPVLTTAEGEVGPVTLRGPGRWEATWSPEPGGGARRVEVAASVGSVRASTSVRVDPAAQRGAVGVWAGGVTNLGAVRSAAGGVDLERALGRREDLAVRFGAAAWTASAHVGPSAGASAERLSSVLYPATAALLVRRERRGLAGWAGVGGSAGPELLRVWSDERMVGSAVRLRAGPAGLVGAGWRLGGRGQLAAELRLSWLLSAPADVGFAGNLGGAGLGIGYREVW